MQASLAGVEIEAAPLKALLAGGVMLATPSDAGGSAAAGTVFRLEESAPAGWHHWSPDLPLTAGEEEAALFASEPDEPTGLHVVLMASNVDDVRR